MKPTRQLDWRLGWFQIHLYSWRAYSRQQDDVSRHRAACCRRALDEGAGVIAHLLARLVVVAAFLEAGRRASLASEAGR